MKIGILSRNRNLYSTRRLLDAGIQNGHQVYIIDTVRSAIQLLLSPKNHVSNPHLPIFDAVIPRIGASVTQHGLRVVRHYENKGSILTASSLGIAQSRDKWTSHQILEQAHIPVPQTKLVVQVDQLWPSIQEIGGLPAILKRRQSTQGRGVMLVTNKESVDLMAGIMSQNHMSQTIIVQRFIPESAGKDIRIIVVGEQCVAAMERQASQGDFRSNLHQGGTATPITLNDKMRDLALKAAKTLGLAVAGIDIIHSRLGYLVLEANSSPGLEGIEHSTGYDIAQKIITYLENKYQGKKQPTPLPTLTASQMFLAKSSLV